MESRRGLRDSNPLAAESVVNTSDRVRPGPARHAVRMQIHSIYSECTAVCRNARDIAFRFQVSATVEVERLDPDIHGALSDVITFELMHSSRAHVSEQ